MTVHFTDGVSIDTSGPYRIITLSDGMYVAGHNMLIPVSGQQEADEIMKEDQ